MMPNLYKVKDLRFWRRWLLSGAVKALQISYSTAVDKDDSCDFCDKTAGALAECEYFPNI
jgi:hypothetical protein